MDLSASQLTCAGFHPGGADGQMIWVELRTRASDIWNQRVWFSVCACVAPVCSVL